MKDSGRPPRKKTQEQQAQARRGAGAGGAPIRIIPEDDFCRLVGVPTVQTLRQQYHSTRDLLARYRLLREDHLRYLVKCGVIQPVVRTNADTFFAFARSGRDQAGQRRARRRRLVPGGGAQPDRVAPWSAGLRLPSRRGAGEDPRRFGARVERAAGAADRDQGIDGPRDTALAEEYFRAGSALDDGDESKLEQAAAAYRKALELDPYLVAALINLANVHYSRDEVVEAQALYERAIGLEPDFFEAHFNLGNIYHDLGRFAEAQSCYREALRLNPLYADAHFYLAVTFEKMGQSQDARPHWKAYRELAPHGEWVELAKEFSE